MTWKSSTFYHNFRRKVSYEEGAAFAKDNNLIFLEVSAKTAYQVEDAFKKNAEQLVEKLDKGVINIKNEVLLRDIIASWDKAWKPGDRRPAQEYRPFD